MTSIAVVGPEHPLCIYGTLRPGPEAACDDYKWYFESGTTMRMSGTGTDYIETNQWEAMDPVVSRHLTKAVQDKRSNTAFDFTMLPGAYFATAGQSQPPVMKYDLIHMVQHRPNSQHINGATYLRRIRTDYLPQAAPPFLTFYDPSSAGSVQERMFEATKTGRGWAVEFVAEHPAAPAVTFTDSTAQQYLVSAINRLKAGASSAAAAGASSAAAGVSSTMASPSHSPRGSPTPQFVPFENASYSAALDKADATPMLVPGSKTKELVEFADFFKVGAVEVVNEQGDHFQVPNYYLEALPQGVGGPLKLDDLAAKGFLVPIDLDSEFASAAVRYFKHSIAFDQNKSRLMHYYVPAPGYYVKEVLLVCNPMLYTSYKGMMDAMTMDKDTEPNEELLFHGTSQPAVKPIALSNFSRDKSSRAQYGQGVYFSPWSSYSFQHNYSVPWGAGTRDTQVKHVFVTRCLTGTSAPGVNAPQQQPRNDGTNKPYDSFYNNEHGSEKLIRIFGEGSDNQLLPLCVLKIGYHS